MRSVILVLFVLFCVSLNGQNKPVSITKSNLTKPKSFGKGSVITVQYDSIIIMDHAKHQESLDAFNNMIKQFTLIKQQYDSCSAYASDGAAKLSAASLSLAASVKRTVDSADVMLVKTKQTLTEAIVNLNSANANLRSVEELLRQEKRSNRRQIMAWTIGGFGVGLLASSVVLLAAHK